MNFNESAKGWDTDQRINRAKIIANEIISSIDNDDDYSAMEFGCGTGLISFNLYNNFKEITLIDSSEGMIDRLNSKINDCKINNMVSKHLDLCNENSLNEKFDVIYNSMVLHHIYDINAIIKKFYQLLNNNGYLCIVDLNEEDGSFHKDDPDFDGHDGFNQAELKRILVNAGFDDVQSHTFFYDAKDIEDEKISYSLFLIKARKHEYVKPF